MEIMSLEDIANVITFIAPGYFAIQIYSLIYAKKDRDFSRLLIESIVYSLPIITIANTVWGLFSSNSPSSLDSRYVILVFLISLLVGLVVAYLRTHWPFNTLASALGLGSPEEDFVKTQLSRIDTKNPRRNVVTVQLKSGSVFSGTVDQFSRYHHGGPMYYYFSNLAWFNENTNDWDEREGGIIVERNEIEYIETKKLSDKR